MYINMFVDMDGVIADYDVGFPSGYDKKRPLYGGLFCYDDIIC